MVAMEVGDLEEDTVPQLAAQKPGVEFLEFPWPNWPVFVDWQAMTGDIRSYMLVRWARA